MSVVRGETWIETHGRAMADLHVAERVKPIAEPIFANKLWLLPLAGALLAPLITWLPMLAIQYPWLGLPRYEPARGIDIWHAQAFWLVVFALVAVLVGCQDRWLGVGVSLLGAGIFLWGGTFDTTHRVGFMAGALVLWAIRQAPREWHPMVTTLLSASGIFQAFYMLQQYLGYDLLWGPLVGGQLKPQLQPLGTLGTVDAASAYVAATAPLMPLWALPFAIGVVYAGHSIGAIVALTVGLLLRWHFYLADRYHGESRRPIIYPLIVAAALLTLWWFRFAPHEVPQVVQGRLGIWWFGIKDWWANGPIVGLSNWGPRIPHLQQQAKYLPTNEVFMEAHNEYLQWIYEHGLLGGAVLMGWLLAHRRMFWGSTVSAALVALAINSGSFFTFHVVSVALLGLILVGIASSTHDHSEEVR